MSSNFRPTVWPEDKFSEETESYRQCELCTQKSRVIWGEGNPQASIFIILDNPGAREDKDGNEYVCPTRQTLQTALFQANLTADHVYVTYLLKCRPLRRYHKEMARAFSKPFLIRQIERTQPKYIVCLGDVVTQTMFNDADACVKNLRGFWHIVLGYPCMVSYHPLAVRRRPNLMSRFMEDWNMLVQRLKHEQQNADS
ncbi:MAG TPA: uracil-DNA glycosylase [Clostridiales bacterium]|nr:uracil-DNA glycosylase [Clostridiales bacterium]